MEKAKRFGQQFDWGYIAVLAITLFALWPFISRAALPQETDAELHIFRLAELASLLRGGEWYPRWAPHFYYGYGYPIFNYYAPLTYYLGFLVEMLPGLNAVDGVKAVFELGLLAAAFGMYGFVRDNWGRAGGLAAAASYLYAPYIVYTDPHARGVLAESFSFGLFPLTLWAFTRLRHNLKEGKGIAAAWCVSTLLIAAMMLTHNLMAMVFIPIIAAWLIIVVLADWRDAMTGREGDTAKKGTHHAPHTTHYTLPFLALILGVALAAFFWLPVILERDAININTLIGQNDNFDFRTHFLSLGELLGPSPWLDWRESGAIFTFNLGIPQWLWGGLGLVMLLWQWRERAAQGWFFALGTVGLIFLMLPISTFLWTSIPVLPYLQFPWRLLGAAAAFLAVLAGIGISKLKLVTSHWSLLTFAILLPILFGLPLTQMPPWPEDFGDVGPARVVAIEKAGRWLGTTSTADFVPATVEVLPYLHPDMVQAIILGNPVDRINRVTLPEGVVVTEEKTTRPLHFRYVVEGDELFRLRLFLFAFPGWEVLLDGQPISIELGRPEGFITAEIPSGKHVVDVRFGSTPARNLAWVVSGIGAMLIGVVAAWLAHKFRDAAAESAAVSHETDTWTAMRGVLGVVLGLFVLFVLVLEPLGWLHENSPEGMVAAAAYPTQADFGGQLSLLGYDLDTSEVIPSESLTLTLYWQAQQDLNIDYQVFVHLLRSDGSLVIGAQSDKLNPGDYPTSRWSLARYVRDVHTITIPADTPPGEYHLSTGLWVQKEGWRLPLFDEAEQQVGDHFILQQIIVK